jgi:transcriptional regulator with XRE-family HTH domain
MPRIKHSSRATPPPTDDLASDIAGRLRARITKLGLSGAEVARRAGISPRMFSYYLTGQRVPKLLEFRALGTALEMTLEELLGDKRELYRDEPAHHAHRRILMACQRLGSGQIETIADMTEFIEMKHQNAFREAASHRLRHLHEIAILHERLIPEFIKRFELEGLETRMVTSARIMGFFLTASFPADAKFDHLKRVIEEMIKNIVPQLASKCKVIFRNNFLEINYTTTVERKR